MGRNRRGRGRGRGVGGHLGRPGGIDNVPAGFQRMGEYGDGNCLFHAIARQAFGDDRLAHCARAELCNFIAANLVPSGNSMLTEEHWRMIHAQREELFQSSDDSRVLRYVHQMRTNGVWGTGLEALCAAYCFHRPVHVWSPTGYSELQPPLYLLAASSTYEPIRLLHNGRNHWDSVQPIVVHRSGLDPDIASSLSEENVQNAEEPILSSTLDEDERAARRRAALAAAEAREQSSANRGIATPSRIRPAQAQLQQKPSNTEQQRQDPEKQIHVDAADVMPTASNASSTGRWARRRQAHSSCGGIDTDTQTTLQGRRHTREDTDGLAPNEVNIDMSHVSELEKCVAALRRVGLSSVEAAEALERNDRNVELVKALYCVDWDADGRTIQLPFTTS